MFCLAAGGCPCPHPRQPELPAGRPPRHRAGGGARHGGQRGVAAQHRAVLHSQGGDHSGRAIRAAMGLREISQLVSIILNKTAGSPVLVKILEIPFTALFSSISHLDRST